MQTALVAPRGRVWLLDEARGLFFLLMVIYHGLYDLVYIFGINIPAFQTQWMSNLQVLVAGMFLFISGIVSHYSRSNLRRGAICLGCGMILTLATLLVFPNQIVFFGVLHLLGVCMLLFALVRPLWSRVPPWLGTLGCAALFFLTYNTQLGYWGMAGWAFPLPEVLYSTPYLFPLGFPNAAFWSSDYLPLLPWMFWFFGGASLGVIVRAGRVPAWVYRPHCRPLAWLGRHTLLIYLLHQPVLYFVLSLLLPGRAA